MIYDKDCSNCEYSDTCATNYCDAVWWRAYNIRDGKDCWKPKYVPMKNLKSGNVFLRGNNVEVAIDDAENGYVWVTTTNYYNEEGIYTQTTACIIEALDTRVRLIANTI